MPKPAFPPKATPNVVISLDDMPYRVNNKGLDILVMIDHRNMILKFKQLPGCTALAAGNAFYSHWFSTFDVPVHVLVDCGSNLTAKQMQIKP